MKELVIWIIRNWYLVVSCLIATIVVISFVIAGIVEWGKWNSGYVPKHGVDITGTMDLGKALNAICKKEVVKPEPATIYTGPCNPTTDTRFGGIAAWMDYRR